MAGTQKYPNAETHDRLRHRARDLIDQGAPLPNHRGSLSEDTLQLLYERATTPESATDALKLLHEFQTYQVELDLLHEQLQANEQEIIEELTHYQRLYEEAPVAYLVVAHDGEIIESNQAAGVLFGESAMPLAGRALSSLLAPGQDSAVNTLLGQFQEQSQGATNASVTLPDRRCLTVSARSAATGGSTLMILTEATTTSAGS